ncbi:11775_t:CDS:2, partial [Acaulospora morrowiae]
NIQTRGEGVFVATWLDGRRMMTSESGRYVQSRKIHSTIDLMILSDSREDCMDFLKIFRHHMQSESEKLVYGLTQNSSSNKYMMLFDYERDPMYGMCSKCSRHNTSKVWCLSCDPHTMTQGWTSGNDEVDNCIKDLQLKTTEYENIVEWVPFDRLDKVKKNDERMLIATWLDGKRMISGERGKYMRSRQTFTTIDLEVFSDSQEGHPDFLEIFKHYVSSEGGRHVYGLTRNPATNEYMALLDYERDSAYGSCAHCNRYNTSKAWCLSCDRYKMTQGWTSGNENVDNCIKEFQLKANDYERAIEWIPFNRLVDIQENGEGMFTATWLDGRRTITGEHGKYVQSRKPSNMVELKILHGSQENHTDFLQRFKKQMQLENNKVYGITQNPDTEEYLM